MKNLLLGVCAISFVSLANAECEDDSFTGLFFGAGVSASFDNIDLDFKLASNATVDGNGNTISIPVSGQGKKNKLAFGGQIVLGYGYQFDNNLYVAIMHESFFTSKANWSYHVKISDDGINPVTDNKGEKGTFIQGSNGSFGHKLSRKCWTPSFGVAIGYVVNGNWNFGFRGGISLDKYRVDQNVSTTPVAQIGDQVIPAMSKSASATSPYVGAYVEYKMGSFIGYLNVDRVFGKKKTFAMGNTTPNSVGAMSIRTKRASWRTAAGIKLNVNFMR